MANIITAYSTYGEEHVPKIFPEYSYDIETGVATVEWTANGGYFNYEYLYFGIQFRRKVDGVWKYTSYSLGGMEYSWVRYGKYSKTILYGSNTQVRFVAKCSAALYNNCDAGWGSDWSADSSWYNILSETKLPTLSLKYYHTREDDGTVKKTISAYDTKLYPQWSLTGQGAHKVQGALYDKDMNLVEMSDLREYSTEHNTGYYSYKNLDVGSYYYFKIAVANNNAIPAEDINEQWEDSYVTKKFRTLEEAPYVDFYSGSSSGTSITFKFKAYYPSTQAKRRLKELAYTVHDDTTNKDVIVDQYHFKDLTSTEAVSNGNAYGTITVTGLTAGHDYTVTPTIARTVVDGIAMQKATSVSINGAIEPSITSIYNSGSSLIFGEPDGSPNVTVVLDGTENVWSITLKIGTSISNGIVTNPVYTSTKAKVGTNTCTLTDTMLDAIYKTINTSSKTTIYTSIEYKLTSDSSVSGSAYKSKTMVLKGNAKTCRVGVSNKPRRAKIWIGVSNKPRRAVAWVGVSNKPRRSL